MSSTQARHRPVSVAFRLLMTAMFVTLAACSSDSSENTEAGEPDTSQSTVESEDEQPAVADPIDNVEEGQVIGVVQFPDCELTGAAGGRVGGYLMGECLENRERAVAVDLQDPFTLIAPTDQSEVREYEHFTLQATTNAGFVFSYSETTEGTGLSGDSTQKVYGVLGLDGKVLWTIPIEPGVWYFDSQDDVVVLASNAPDSYADDYLDNVDPILTAYDARTGEQTFEVQVEGEVYGLGRQPTEFNLDTMALGTLDDLRKVDGVNGTVTFGVVDGLLSAFDDAGKELWSEQLPDGASVTGAGDYLWVSIPDGDETFRYVRVDVKTGESDIEFPSPVGVCSTIRMISPDGAIGYAETCRMGGPYVAIRMPTKTIP